jgi:IS30 family transposase
MWRPGPPGLSVEQRAETWRRWKAGLGVRDIGRTLGFDHGSIRSLLVQRGGIAPPARKRAGSALTLAEREDISRGIAAGATFRSIAARLGRAPSTVSREVARHGGRDRYRAARADDRAWQSALRPKKCLLARSRTLCDIVASRLALEWSPEQISGWLKDEFPHDSSLRVSHETIYRSLFIQARGVLKKDLMQHLRSGRRLRRAIKTDTHGEQRGKIADAVSIRERPADVEDRAVPGHWEGDLLSGSKNSHIVTLVERHSRFTSLIKVPNKETATVVAALTRQIRKLPAALRRSLTWDRGHEMAKHKAFTVATNVNVYFCDPHSPWQRGTNENTNRLLRQYFPRGTDLSRHSQSDLDKIALRLNQRPRETLGFKTPAYKLQASVAPTH